MNRLNPAVATVVTVILAILLAVYVFAGGSRRSPDRDKLSEGDIALQQEKRSDGRCQSQQTLDLLKSELFRRAAEMRGSDPAAFESASSASQLRVTSPRPARASNDPNNLDCQGAVSLDLAPGLAVVGGSSSLQAELVYAMQASTVNGSAILTVSNAETLIATLSTLTRVKEEQAVEELPADLSEERRDVASRSEDRGTRSAPPVVRPPPPPAPVRAAPREVIARPRPVANRPMNAPPPRAVARPSFNCRNARTGGEVAVCGSPALAGLDRQMAGQFNAAMSVASPGQRDLLQRTRGSFLRFRDSCGSEACMAGAYRDRMREIADILADRWHRP